MKSRGFYAVLAMSLLAAPMALANPTDDLAREQAQAACASGDLPALFAAMTISDAVRQQYLAPTITLADGKGVSQVPAADYAALPIGMLDYAYVTRASLDAGEQDAGAVLTYIEAEFNQSQDNRWRVDWTELTGPLLEGAEDGEQPQPTGRAGYLLFFPQGECWQLVEDHRDEAR